VKLDDPSQIRRDGNTITVALWYPTCVGNATCIEVELVDVRAADSIRVCFDHERNGYVVEQPRRTQVLMGQEGEIDRYEERVEWQETAFLKAWAFG